MNQLSFCMLKYIARSGLKPFHIRKFSQVAKYQNITCNEVLGEFKSKALSTKQLFYQNHSDDVVWDDYLSRLNRHKLISNIYHPSESSTTDIEPPFYHPYTLLRSDPTKGQKVSILRSDNDKPVVEATLETQCETVQCDSWDSCITFSRFLITELNVVGDIVDFT